MSRQYLARPGDGVAGADACWLRARPKLQVLGTVVVPDTVAMVHVLPGQEIPAEHLLHDKNVFEDVVPGGGSRMVGRPNHDIALLVSRPAASPVAV